MDNEFWEALNALEDECDRAVRKGYAWHGLEEALARLDNAQRPNPEECARYREALERIANSEGTLAALRSLADIARAALKGQP